MQTEKQSNREKVLMKTQSSSYSAAATVQRIQAAPEPTADNANTGGLQTLIFITLWSLMIRCRSLSANTTFLCFCLARSSQFFFSISHLLTTTVNN